MKSCQEYTGRQVQDYFLNRMHPEEMEAFQFHLLQCDICKANLAGMRRLATGWKEEELGEAMPGGPLDPPRNRSLSFHYFTRVAAVAGLLLLLAGGGYFFLSAPSDRQVPVEMDEPPVYHAADSVMPEDSTPVETEEFVIEDVE